MTLWYWRALNCLYLINLHMFLLLYIMFPSTIYIFSCRAWQIDVACWSTNCMQKWPQQNRIVLRNVTPFVWQVDCLGIVNVIICHNVYVCWQKERGRGSEWEGQSDSWLSQCGCWWCCTCPCRNVDAVVNVERMLCVCGFNLVAKLTMRHDNTPSTWTASS